MNGVLSSEFDIGRDTVTVVFDNEKIKIDDIRNALTKGGFPLMEEPVVLK